MYFRKDLHLLKSWYISGTHYSQTLEAWLKLQDSQASRWLNPQAKEKMLDDTKAGQDDAKVTFYRFRLFFLSCAEFFGLDNGQQWGVAHYLFRKRD